MSKDIDIESWLKCGTLISSGNKRLLLGWGKREWRTTPSDHPLQPSFYFPDFFLKQEACWFTHEFTLEIENERLLSLLTPLQTQGCQIHWKAPDYAVFSKFFNELKLLIEKGSLEKGVPFVQERCETPLSKEQLIRSLYSILQFSLSNPAFLYGFWDKDQGILGASPETLFRLIDSRRLETVACAGTTKADGNVSYLLQSQKELHEHQVVVDAIASTLSPYGKVTIGDLKPLTFNALSHLARWIHVDLEYKPHFTEIVQALHPTPAVGAYPKNQGSKWLQEMQEKVNRNRFGAPVGYTIPAKNRANCYVAIRNMQWDAHQSYICAGCGVVKDSTLEGEWEELGLKIRAIKEMLAI